MLTEKWANRFRDARTTGEEEFSFPRLVELWGITRANISVSLNAFEEEYPAGVVSHKDGSRKIFRFNYDALLGEDSEDNAANSVPTWLRQTTWDNMLELVNLPDEYRFELVGINWDARFQRGGIEITVYEVGQKRPEFSGIMRFDNCIVVSDSGWTSAYRAYFGGE